MQMILVITRAVREGYQDSVMVSDRQRGQWCFSRQGGQGRRQVTPPMRKQQGHDLGKRVPRRGKGCAKALRQGQPWAAHRTERGDAAPF